MIFEPLTDRRRDKKYSVWHSKPVIRKVAAKRSAQFSAAAASEVERCGNYRYAATELSTRQIGESSRRI